MTPADPTTMRGRWLRFVYATGLVPDKVRVLLLVMAEHMDENGRVEISRSDLAALLSRTPRRISERLAEAIEGGLLTQERRGSPSRPAAYSATLPGEEEQVTPGGHPLPRKQVTESSTPSQETGDTRGASSSQETGAPRGAREGLNWCPPGGTSSGPPIREGSFEAPSPDTAPSSSEDESPTLSRHRVNALVAVYHQATNGMSDQNKVRSVVKKALENGYTAEEITRGLEHVAADGRFALTADTLRIAINRSQPRPQLRVVGGHTPYRNPSDYGENPDPWA